MKQIVKLLTLMCRKAHLPAFALMALLSGLSAHADVVINETTFPDANFRNFILSQTYGQDGVLTDAEIAEVDSINCTEKEIASLEGIGNFTALKKLICRQNQLSYLDLSNNLNLVHLDCGLNQLTTLDVSNNITLKELQCDYNQLSELNVSSNRMLKKLYCYENQLISLDLNTNVFLDTLFCNDNKLTMLNINNCTELTVLRCSYNQLTVLDVSNNTALKVLECEKNQLSDLDITKNAALIELSCGNNRLSKIDLSKNTLLKRLRVSFNQLTNIDLSDNIELQSLNVSNNLLSSLDISSNLQLSWLNFMRNKIAEIDISKHNLTNLFCGENLLTTLDLSNQTELYDFKCNGNKLTELDLSTTSIAHKHQDILGVFCNFFGQTRDLTAESAVTSDGEHYYYLRLDENTDNDQPIWARMTETNVGGVVSKFDPSRVLEWTSGGTVVDGQKRVATTAEAVNPQNVTGKILLLTNAIEDPATNTASGSVTYTYDVKYPFETDKIRGDFTLNWTAPIPNNPITAVTDLRDGREKVSVTYTNLAGQVSDTPFNGINIVTTRYSDGTTNATKVIK